MISIMLQWLQLSILPKFTYVNSRDEIPYSFHFFKIFISTYSVSWMEYYGYEMNLKQSFAQRTAAQIPFIHEDIHISTRHVSGIATFCNLTNNLWLLCFLSWLPLCSSLIGCGTFRIRKNLNLHNEVASLLL